MPMEPTRGIRRADEVRAGSPCGDAVFASCTISAVAPIDESASWSLSEQLSDQRRTDRSSCRECTTAPLKPVLSQHSCGMVTTSAIRTFAGCFQRPRQLLTDFPASLPDAPVSAATENHAPPPALWPDPQTSRGPRTAAPGSPEDASSWSSPVPKRQFMPGISTSLTRMSGAMAAAISSAPAASYAVRVQKPARLKMMPRVSATRCSSSTTRTMGSLFTSPVFKFRRFFRREGPRKLELTTDLS